MDMDTPSRRASSAPRTRLNVSCLFRRRYSRENEEGALKNISESGAFLAQPNASLPIKSKVHLILDFLGHKREIICEVVWSNEKGSGIKFLPNVGRDKRSVEDFIEYINEQKNSKYQVLNMIFKRVG